jgi:hypothetical protein
MTRIKVYLDGRLRIDESATNADLERLDEAVEQMETDCLAYNHRLLIVAQEGNVHAILVRI